MAPLPPGLWGAHGSVMRRALLSIALLAVTACDDPIAEQAAEPALKPSAIFAGLPLSGNLSTALAAGFGACLEATRGLRCQKADVMVMGIGPLRAAVDLDVKRAGGAARFDHVTLWHPSDQSVTIALRPLLEKQGWQSCLTPDAERLWNPPSPIRIAIDTSYWGSRRLVISAPAPSAERYC